MAFVGMRHPVVATLTAHTAGSEPTYGTGMVLGHAIAGNLTITRNNNPLYADDTIVEDDNSVTSMSLELGVDDLTETVRAYMLGLVKKSTGTGTTVDTYYDTDAAAPYVGFGYIRVRRLNGATKYEAIWYYKGMFSEEAENSATKGESIEWQTPTITARVMGLAIDSTGALTFRKKQYFDTEGDAVTWLNGLAGIS